MLHQRLAWRTGLATGTWAIIVGSGGAAVVDTAAAAARPRPGLGTLCNVVLIGAVVDLVLATVAPPHSLPARAAVMVAAVGLNGVATGLYIGAGLGPGPRDGLMTGLAARGHSLRVARTGIEATVLLAGWLHGGTVGSGTWSTRPASARSRTSSCRCSAGLPPGRPGHGLLWSRSAASTPGVMTGVILRARDVPAASPRRPR